MYCNVSFSINEFNTFIIVLTKIKFKNANAQDNTGIDILYSKDYHYEQQKIGLKF